MKRIRQLLKLLLISPLTVLQRFRHPRYRDAQARLARIRSMMEDIVCTQGIDKGIILVSDDAPTHREIIDGKTVVVYNHEYFSPLGDALIKVWEMTLPNR